MKDSEQSKPFSLGFIYLEPAANRCTTYKDMGRKWVGSIDMDMDVISYAVDHQY
jgi:hypothetical protein